MTYYIANHNAMTMVKVLDTNLLRTFVAISDCGGFGRAGERLNFAQPTISLHIKRLEEHLDTKLFRRDGRRMVITEDGHKLLRYARRILTLNEEVWSSVGPSGVSGSVRIGIIQDLTEEMLSDLIRDFARDYPSVRLEMMVANTAELEEGLKTGKLDIAIMTGTESAQTPLFRREPLVWIGSERFDLRDQEVIPLVLCSSPCGLRDMALSLLEANDVKWRLAFSSPSLSGVKSAVQAGLGITLRGVSTLEPGLVRLDDAFGLPALPQFEIVVKKSPQSEDTPAINAMKDLVTAFATQNV